jgi:hypothetical protein
VQVLHALKDPLSGLDGISDDQVAIKLKEEGGGSCARIEMKTTNLIPSNAVRTCFTSIHDSFVYACL